MLLKIHGAAREVTGSNYLLEANGYRVLVDCGLHQGSNEDANWEPFPYLPSSIDAVLLTHAHIDHSGRLPLLVKQGFHGKIFCTLPTVELVGVLWDDSAKLMREEAEWKTKKNARKGLPPVEPLFGQEDVDRAKGFFSPVNYDDRIEIVPGIHVRFRDAGHILGSAILELGVMEDGKIVRLVFSGDLGPQHTVMERQPAEITEADYVIIESTYGNREHRGNEETRAEFQALMKEILDRKSKVYIPTFVVDRAQRVMYELALLKEQGFGEDLPVYFDSPMGVNATKIYESHMDLMSRELQEYRLRGGEPFSPENLVYVSTVEDSQAINKQKYGIVLAGSGMCNGGRIVHHLKNGIWNPENHVVFVGYQAVGTLGRKIVSGAKRVRISGEEISVKAKIHTIGGFSAHSDRTDLLTWAEYFRLSMPTFLVTHGEPEAAESLASALRQRGFDAAVPSLGQEFILQPGAAGQRIQSAIEEARAAPQVDPIEETPIPASDKPADLSVEDQDEKIPKKKLPKAVSSESVRTEPGGSGASVTDRQILSVIDHVEDLMQEVFDRASSGKLSMEDKPLLDSVGLLLETLLDRSSEKKDSAASGD